MDNPIWTARLAILPFALVEWTLIVWFGLFGNPDPASSLKQLASWLCLVAAVLGTVVLQIYVYRYLTLVTSIVDEFVYVVLLVEQVIALVLLFWLVSRSSSLRSHNPR